MSALLYEMLADCEEELDNFVTGSFWERTFTRLAYWAFETRNSQIESMPGWYREIHGYSKHSDDFPLGIYKTWSARLLGLDRD